MALSPDARWVAVGGKTQSGEYTATVWDVRTTREVITPYWSSETYKAPTAVRWVTGNKESQKLLVWGSQTGFVIMWKVSDMAKVCVHARQQVKPVDSAITDEVTSIASSLIDDHIRLLVSTGGRTIVSYAMGDKIPFKVFELQLRDYLPRTVECLPDGKVLAFSMYDGVMLRIDPRGEKELMKVPLDCGFIASAIVDGGHKMVLVDNVYGFTLYWISNGARIRRFQATTISGRPRAAAFGEYGGVVITSGNQGSAHVYDLTIKGETPAMQELRHADEGEVHHVASTAVGTRSIAVCASRDDFHVSVWERVIPMMDKPNAAPAPPPTPKLETQHQPPVMGAVTFLCDAVLAFLRSLILASMGLFIILSMFLMSSYGETAKESLVDWWEIEGKYRLINVIRDRL